jgi:hypothetical protein
MRQALIWLRRYFLNRENLWAIIICLFLVILMTMTADSSPLWIYQGF